MRIIYKGFKKITNISGYQGVTVLYRTDSLPFDRDCARRIGQHLTRAVFLSERCLDHCCCVIGSHDTSLFELADLGLSDQEIAQLRVVHYLGGLYNPQIYIETRELFRLV